MPNLNITCPTCGKQQKLIGPRCECGETCEWTRDEWHDYWDTKCGHALCFEGGKPDVNTYRYCPSCGRVIKLKEKL